MEHKKEHLENLLKLINDISKEEANEWFVKELQQRFTPLTKKVEDHSEYLQKIFGRKFKHDGNQHYTLVKDAKLKQELSNNFKRMRLCYLMGDYVQYGKQVTLQLEAIFSYIVSKLDVANIIKSRHPSLNLINTIDIKKFPNSKPVDLLEAFIDDKGEILKNITYKAKAIFCLDYYKILFVPSFGNFQSLYSLRNYDSHSKFMTNEIEKVEKTIYEVPSKIGFYEKMFHDYTSCINFHFKSL